MEQTCIHASTWYHALTLTDRLASLRSHQDLLPHGAVDADLAERRLQRWRSQAPFTTGSYFAQRLSLDGLSEDDLFALLGEPIEAVEDRCPSTPDWLVELAEAFSQPASSWPLPLPDGLRSQATSGFLNVIEPLIRQARDRVRAGIQTLISTCAALPFDPGTVEAAVFANLPGQLLMMMDRTLVLELHVTRLQGLLQGAAAAERFHSFLQRLRLPEIALGLLQEYPVLARQVTLCLDHWAASSLEFLQRLCADWESIRAAFCPELDPGVLMQVEGGVGDKHRDGRSVLLARFSSGFQVVYKPKPLAVDVHFQELLAWLNERGVDPPFRTLKVLDRGGYGWTEFVVAQGCSSSDEVRRFYERQGSYLALLYALEATDFHSENLVAVTEHPMLVDLEALFHPRAGGMDLHQADEVASSTINYSVLRVGLLPQRMWSNAESEGVDWSGLGAVASPLSAHTVPYWEGAGTDEMRLARKRIALRPRQHRPTLGGTEVDVLDYTEAIVTGFTNVYRLLLQHREELVSDRGPLARFAGDEVRVIVRPTQTYALLLRQSFHPDLLRDALDRDRFFDRLWMGVEHAPYLLKVVPAECQDLRNGDIPLFTTRPASRTLWTSAHEPLADFFDESGMTLVQRRLRRLSDEDYAQQLWIIRASLATLAPGVAQARWPAYQLTEPENSADPERLLEAARAVGDRLEALALRGAYDVSWIGLKLTGKDQWSLVPLTADLYDGLPGVTLFLAYLGAITGEERYTSLAQTVLTTFRRQVDRGRAGISSIGGFDGWGGVIYTLTHLGALWKQPALVAEAEVMVQLLPDLIEQDKHLDVIGGAAGCIASLISLYRCAPSPRTLAAARQCGDRLLARAQPMEQGVGWANGMAGERPLTGFSHGAAGMAWALFQLAALTGAERFRLTALAAIAYERKHFSPTEGNWPDFRVLKTSDPPKNNGQPMFQLAWCHGAPGIGLARLGSLPYFDDAAVRAEIETALQTTLARGFGDNHSLCHGDLGNLELLLQASQVFKGSSWCTQVHRLAGIILESMRREKWICGTSLGVESPGLMTGLAGIGYELLRLAEPALVPSVLLLAPPIRTQ
jgi:type 2 lantibiotic biosynthesis protein LanM